MDDGVCSGDESCQCGDCVDGGEDDKDKCSIIDGTQALCSDDIPDDGKPGACCLPPESWDTETASCRSCTNTQAPNVLKAGFDQPYIACTGDGNVANTHFRYRITKEGGTDAPFISELYTIGTQVLHSTIPTSGTYTVNCFYGTASAVDTTATPHECTKTMTVSDGKTDEINGCSRVFAYKGSTLSDEMTSA